TWRMLVFTEVVFKVKSAVPPKPRGFTQTPVFCQEYLCLRLFCHSDPSLIVYAATLIFLTSAYPLERLPVTVATSIPELSSLNTLSLALYVYPLMPFV